MAIFNSYVSLPKGIDHLIATHVSVSNCSIYFGGFKMLPHKNNPLCAFTSSKFSDGSRNIDDSWLVQLQISAKNHWEIHGNPAFQTTRWSLSNETRKPKNIKKLHQSPKKQGFSSISPSCSWKLRELQIFGRPKTPRRWPQGPKSTPGGCALFGDVVVIPLLGKAGDWQRFDDLMGWIRTDFHGYSLFFMVSNVGSWLVARVAIVAIFSKLFWNSCIVWRVRFCGKTKLGEPFFLKKL